MKVVIMILQTSKELKYLIDVLEKCFNNAITVHLHNNHVINESSTIKYESELTISDYKNKNYLLALDSASLEYKPLTTNLNKYESKDKFIIWYEKEKNNINYVLLEYIIYTTLVKSVDFIEESDNWKKILDYNDIIDEGDRHYYIQI